MKKESVESRKWNQIHIYDLQRRQTRKNKSQTSNSPKRTGKPRLRSNEGQRYTKTITCPENFVLSSNHEEVVKVIDDIRNSAERQRNERVYIDFRTIRRLSPGAALILVAELDCWNSRPMRGRLRPVDLNEWNENIRSQLNDMGFFELLKVNSNELANLYFGKTSSVYVRFRTGSRVEGQSVDNLRTADLDPYVSVPNRHLLFAAVTEAMTNVVHHAYSGNLEHSSRKHWWLSASHNVERKEIRILIYDRGVGIPESLPRKWKEQLRHLLPDTFTHDDSKMIKAAHDLSRSITQLPFRGHGLDRDIRKYVEKIDCDATYRVVSGNGEYTYRVKSSKKPIENLRNFKRPLRGTLIEWRLAHQ